MAILTADLIDRYGDALQSCETQFRQFGRAHHFHGPVRTLRTFEDNALLRELLSKPGNGAVLIVDGAGSMRTALLGDQLATLAEKNHWAGVIINGVVRDSAALASVAIGIKALGTNPRKSAKSRIGEIDVVVSFGAASFSPGDWVFSDDDGLVVSKQQLADEANLAAR